MALKAALESCPARAVILSEAPHFHLQLLNSYHCKFQYLLWEPMKEMKGCCRKHSDMLLFCRACCFGSLKRVSKSLKVLFNGIEAVMALTVAILK